MDLPTQIREEPKNCRWSAGGMAYDLNRKGHTLPWEGNFSNV